jgi:hypothetical protein
MPKINPQLLQRLQSKLGVGHAQVYSAIARKSGESFLPRHKAAIALAAEHGINISKFASEDDLASIRSAAGQNSLPIQKAPSHLKCNNQARQFAGFRLIATKIT